MFRKKKIRKLIESFEERTKKLRQQAYDVDCDPSYEFGRLHELNRVISELERVLN